jgi:hypothetical protein
MRATKENQGGFFTRIVNWCCNVTWHLAKIRAVTIYVKAIRAARLAFMGLIGLWCVLLLMTAGFILAHIALLILLPVSLEIKALVLLILSGIYFLIGVIVIAVASSQRLWMRYSGASDMVRSAVRD